MLQNLDGLYQRNEKIAMLTCYDATFSYILEKAGIDAILVGDSLGNVIHGNKTTVKVTLDDIIYHTTSVARGITHTPLISDLPFGQLSSLENIYQSCVQIMRAGAEMIKIEGDAWIAEIIKYLSDRGIPICAHIGLQPQYVFKQGGFKVQGKSAKEAEKIINTARLLQSSGAKMVLVESVPSKLTKQLTETLTVPVIGIGAGKNCSGQILVLYDILGLHSSHVSLNPPKFTKNFLKNESCIFQAIKNYIQEVKDESFPGLEHTFE